MRTGRALAAALLLLPLWSQLGGTVVDVRPDCGAIVQAQDPRTGQGDPDGYALLLGTTDASGDSLTVGQTGCWTSGAGWRPTRRDRSRS